MSMEAAKAFMERMKTDEEFAKKVIEIQDADRRMAVVKAEGFEFTTAELNGIQGEMSDEELDRVAGGLYVRCAAYPEVNFNILV